MSLCGLSVVMTIITLHMFFKEGSEPVTPLVLTLTRWAQNVMCRRSTNGSSKTQCSRNTVRAVPSDVNHQAFAPKQAFSAKDELRSVSTLGARDDSQEEDGAASKAQSTDVTSWKEASRVLHAFMFRAYIVIVSLLFFIYIAIVGSSG
jgi:hypothetical protein